MNDQLARIRELDEKIKKLDKILDRGEYKAAGLDIEIRVGANRLTTDLEVELGITADLESILKSIHRGMLDARAWRVSQASQEYKELHEYFNPSDIL